MTVYILCLVHKRAFNFIEVIGIFVDDERAAFKAKEKFNYNKPAYAMAVIKNYNSKIDARTK